MIFRTTTSFIMKSCLTSHTISYCHAYWRSLFTDCFSIYSHYTLILNIYKSLYFTHNVHDLTFGSFRYENVFFYRYITGFILFTIYITLFNSYARQCLVGYFYNIRFSFCKLYSFCRSYCCFFLTLSRHCHCSILHVIWFCWVYILCYLCRTIAPAVTFICWLHPKLNKSHLISSHLILSYLILRHQAPHGQPLTRHETWHRYVWYGCWLIYNFRWLYFTGFDSKLGGQPICL